MREILFRGKTINNGEWVYGYYTAVVEHGDNGASGHQFRATATLLHYISDCDGTTLIVFPETVGQYTGLEDANGKKIFEGDILKDRESMVIVRFVDGEFSVDYKTLGGKWRHYENLFNYLEDYEGEAVGNMTDNPELLTEEVK